ncbi:MAG: prephenate dehydrogenase/arogenate dehydrogenase family protein [Candidatus Omnitrophota bacterium]
MKPFNKAAIIGVGLIGGSVALAMKRKRLAKKIVGVSRHKKSISTAKRLGAIDEGSLSLGIIRGADLVVLSLPVKTIINLAPKISRIVAKDCLITDAGSTKKEIVTHLDKIFTNFIGSHPLAGSEKRGVVNAEAGLFEDSLCILTPTLKTSRLAKEKAKALWSELGVKTVFLSADKHDKILSFSSHLAHAVAFSLISSVPDKDLRFSSNGLKDTTRLASSDSCLWRDIFLSNQKNMLQALTVFEQKLKDLKEAIRKKDAKKLKSILKQAKIKRDSLS